MKLLFCQDCSGLVVPSSIPDKPRFCDCERHGVWWVNPEKGILKVYDSKGQGQRESLYPREPRAYVIGLTNLLLTYEGSINADVIQELIDEHPEFYLFKQWRSLVIKIRPGESSDTSWGRLP